MQEIIDMFNSMGETDDVATILKTFTELVNKIVALITQLFNGDFSGILGTEESTSTNA